MRDLFYANRLRQRRQDKIRLTVLLITTVSFGASVAIAQAQSPVTTIKLGRDQIGTVRTTPGLSTRISFPEVVQEIICGDLYDPGRSVGNFVIQRSGKDVFIKPVAPKGVSNMFVKTGENAEHIYNFDLHIVNSSQAHRIVNVLSAVTVAVKGTVATNEARPPLKSPPVIARIDFSDAQQAINARHDSLAGKIWVSTGQVDPPPGIDHGSGRPQEHAANPVEIQGEPIKIVRPAYPGYARPSGISGEVEVEITVDETGRVKSAKAISGPKIFRQAAIYAAQDWRFTPTKVNGVPVQATGRITFIFTRPSRFSTALNLSEYVWGAGRVPRK